ncbi:MAG: indole-3-glycerol phosphate synthase TrpC [Acidobacteria bacterium]|nr:indole-3-glycerol phosphate synthase TrpC [Acidobacteriota bacterium]
MNSTFLNKVIDETRAKVARVKSGHYSEKLRRKAQHAALDRKSHRFRTALAGNGRTNIIAEIKRASPSRGVINASIDVAARALSYERGGAAAVSVLTEPQHFGGSIDDIVKARTAIRVPILRKDFIVDEFQILEAAAAGADAVLLIAAALDDRELLRLRQFAENEFGLDALVEIHDEYELERAVDADSMIIGVNNRNLKSLDVSLDVARRLAVMKPDGVIFVAESGISMRHEIDELHGLGYDAFLIGEALMKSGDPAGRLEEFGA